MSARSIISTAKEGPFLKAKLSDLSSVFLRNSIIVLPFDKIPFERLTTNWLAEI